MNTASEIAVPDAGRQLASLPLAVILVAPGRLIAAVNPAAEQLLGQSRRRLEGRRLSEVLIFTDSRLAERIATSDMPVTAREIAVSIGGQMRRLDLQIAPVVDEVDWHVLTLHDATAAETMGKTTGKDSENFGLRAPDILAHEIKNPLAGIRGAAQLLARKVGEGDKPLTALIADEVDRIAALIDHMQTLSRRTPADLSACNLHEAIRRAIAIFSAAQTANMPIIEAFDPSLPPVFGNADALVQVLINLIANARDAVENIENPKIIIRTRFASGLQLHSGENGKPVRLPIELRISDNGPGIDPALHDHLFEPFVTSKKNGQGLGLALVRKLVRDMNGRINHERDASEGWTHFRVHLPLVDEQTRAGAPTP